MILRTTILLALLLLGACSPNSDATPPPKLFKEQRDVLEKAKGVDTTQQHQNDEQRKALEQQTQ